MGTDSIFSKPSLSTGVLHLTISPSEIRTYFSFCLLPNGPQVTLTVLRLADVVSTAVRLNEPTIQVTALVRVAIATSCWKTVNKIRPLAAGSHELMREQNK